MAGSQAMRKHSGRKSFGFGKKFGMAGKLARGRFRHQAQGIRTGGSGVMKIRHKGPKNLRAGKLAFFQELGGTGQKSLAAKRR